MSSMAQPPPNYNPQQQSGIPNVNLQQILGQKPMTVPGGMQFQQSNPNPPVVAPLPAEKTIIDDFELSYQSCIAPMLPGTDNAFKMTIPPEKLRASMDLSIQEFTENSRKVEAFFLKKHAILAHRQPELILQEELEVLRKEIGRRDTAIQNQMTKLKTWLEMIRNLQKSVQERQSVTPTANSGQTTMQPPQTGHPDVMQQQLVNQRR